MCTVGSGCLTLLLDIRLGPIGVCAETRPRLVDSAITAYLR